MKASYLDRRGFLHEARGLVERSEELGREPFARGSTALLVIDMQGWFLEPSSHAYLPEGRRIIPRIRALSVEFASAGLPVVFTRHLNTPGDAGSMGTWWSDLITEDDPLSAVSPELDVSLGSVLAKTQYDAFHGTGLESVLCDRGMTRVVIAGVATHLCCETTARSAFVRGFHVTVPFDATATYDERHHLASLLNLSHGFAAITSTETIIRALRESGARGCR